MNSNPVNPDEIDVDKSDGTESGKNRADNDSTREPVATNDGNEDINPAKAIGQGVDVEESNEDVSLELLSRAYAKVIAEQSATPIERDRPEKVEIPSETAADKSVENKEHDFPVSPESILEAMLFVGLPGNQPITSRNAANLMRGVSPMEIDQMVVTLNEQYENDDSAYRIVTQGQGFELRLSSEMSPVREKFYGEVRDARLSQAAIEVLAVVAYNQPVSREEVDKVRLHGSGTILNQLVRRDLLTVQRDPQKKRLKLYSVTDRFLELFALESITDLPHAEFDEML